MVLSSCMFISLNIAFMIVAQFLINIQFLFRNMWYFEIILPELLQCRFHKGFKSYKAILYFLIWVRFKFILNSLNQLKNCGTSCFYLQAFERIKKTKVKYIKGRRVRWLTYYLNVTMLIYICFKYCRIVRRNLGSFVVLLEYD